MKPSRTLIGGRYQYSPSEPLRQTKLYTEYRAYDKVTKRDLIMQKHEENDNYIEKIRDIKHVLVHLVFDVVKLEEEGKVAIFFEPGVQANLEEVLHKNHYLTQSDALVIFKFALLGLRQLHEKLITYERMCPENILFCTHSIVKLGCVSYPSQVPIQTRSPEVLREQNPNYASDIYSLGVVLYKMLYGCYPFEGNNEEDLLSEIKSKRLKQVETASPFKIVVSEDISFLLNLMLDYSPEKRPTLEKILKIGALSFNVETQAQSYIKPKGNIIPEPFLRKYLVFRASKVTYRIDEYYEQNCFLALNIKQKQFMSLYAPDVKMFESDPRKIQSYYQKLRAIKESYLPESCGFLCRIDDYERFRREPVIMVEYCNQGDLYHYLRKKQQKMSEKEINIIMYLVAIAYKQMKDIGVTSIHTVHPQRIMIKNKNIKLRQPGLLTPFIEAKLMSSIKIDYFAPELKEKADFVELDKSDMWSYGVLYYYLIRGSLPEITPETKTINIQILDINKKNKNLIGKCLDQNVTKRLTLEQIKIQGVNQKLLQQMLQQKRRQDEADEQYQNSNEDIAENENKGQNNRIVFKRRKKRWCGNYNKIIANSSTSTCRITLKVIFGLIALWIIFFGNFFINGGLGLLRTNYYRKITLQVPYNYATSLYNLTILTTNGTKFDNQYKDFSYEQIMIDLNCTDNNHSSIATGEVNQYINYSHSVQCLFGFVFLIIFSVCYGVALVKLDLPRVLVERKEKDSNAGVFQFVMMFFVISSLLFCFFTIFSLEYIIQMTPCLGLANQAYPKFTSIQSLLDGNVGTFFRLVFPTVILWSIIMILYLLLSLLHKKISLRIMQYKFFIPAIAVMVIYTIVCRVGFGGPIPLEPSWTYRMNKDLTSQYWGLFGMFPQILLIALFCIDRLIDFLFWFFLRLGMEPVEQQDIKQVQFNAKLEPIDGKLDSSNAKINMIQNDFEIFD